MAKLHNGFPKWTGSKGWNIPYYGLTYPHKTDAQLKAWERKNCKRNMHLFDECKGGEHVLVCDACGLRVHIAHIETLEQSLARIENNEEPPPFVIKARKTKHVKSK